MPWEEDHLLVSPQHGQGQSWEIPSKKISFAENWAVALEKIIGGDLFLTTRVIGEVAWQGRIRRRRMKKGKMPQESLGEFACSCLADKEALGRSWYTNLRGELPEGT